MREMQGVARRAPGSADMRAALAAMCVSTDPTSLFCCLSTMSPALPSEYMNTSSIRKVLATLISGCSGATQWGKNVAVPPQTRRSRGERASEAFHAVLRRYWSQVSLLSARLAVKARLL